MGYCVFMVRPDSIYDDNPVEQYQFPKIYYERAMHALGDWVVYLEPTKVRNTRGYFAMARVEKIIPDQKERGLFLAIIDSGSYLDFAQPVPFSDESGPNERGLLNENGRLSGRAQAAVRPILPSDFLRIIEQGLDHTEELLPRLDDTATVPEVKEDQSPFVFEVDRQRVQQLTTRNERDKAFRKRVLYAYEERCAITGLKFINGGGRAEVNAAHIRPVDKKGPDTILNGIALSGTAHWMFDRGLISLSDDLEILISRKVNDVDGVQAFINKDGRAIPPKRRSDWPHPRFLGWHRENCFER